MRRLLLLGLVAGCTPSQIIVRRPPKAAIEAAEARFVEREVVLDAAGRRPDRLRTGTFCYPVPDEREPSWDASFGRTRPGPVPFTAEGPMAAQDAAVAECPYLFQIEVVAVPHADGAQLVVHDAWWRAVAGACEPVGDRLTGVLACEYRYEGAQAQGKAAAFFYGLLNGL